MSKTFEIEIKSLLGSKVAADALKARMLTFDPTLREIGTHRQLNHYFIGGDLSRLPAAAASVLSPENVRRLSDIAREALKFSVRTRQADEQVLLVVKASVDETTSSNGTARLEYEAEANCSLEALDELILQAGFSVEAKWSRERTEYKMNDVNVSIDKNAGYGYLAEFEKLEDAIEKAEGTKEELRALMQKLEASELPQDRLERMFAHYNAHWPEYYGTDNIFFIE